MAAKLRLCFAGLLLSLGACRAEPGAQGPPFWAGKLWSGYSPYAPAGSYAPPPPGCSIEQVNLVSDGSRSACLLPLVTARSQIQRHGARYPTKSARKRYLDSLAKLKSVPRYVDSRLDFLKDYTVELGADDLISFGAKE